MSTLGASFVLIFGLQPWHLTQNSKIHWNFLGDRNGFCSNEATVGGLLGGFRMQALQKDKPWLEIWGSPAIPQAHFVALSPPPHFVSWHLAWHLLWQGHRNAQETDVHRLQRSLWPGSIPSRRAHTLGGPQEARKHVESRTENAHLLPKVTVSQYHKEPEWSRNTGKAQQGSAGKRKSARTRDTMQTWGTRDSTLQKGLC